MTALTFRAAKPPDQKPGGAAGSGRPRQRLNATNCPEKPLKTCRVEDSVETRVEGAGARWGRTSPNRESGSVPGRDFFRWRPRIGNLTGKVTGNPRHKIDPAPSRTAVPDASRWCAGLDEDGGGAGRPPRAVGAVGSGGGGDARHLAPPRLRPGGEGRAPGAPARRSDRDPPAPPRAPPRRRAMTAGARRRAPEDRSDPLDMSVAEPARILGISRTLAYDLVASGQLPSFRMGGRLRVPRRPWSASQRLMRRTAPAVLRRWTISSAARPCRLPSRNLVHRLPGSCRRLRPEGRGPAAGSPELSPS